MINGTVKLLGQLTSIGDLSFRLTIAVPSNIVVVFDFFSITISSMLRPLFGLPSQGVMSSNTT